MISLLLALLAFASSQDNPKISYLIVSASFTKEDYDEIEDWGDHKDDLIDACVKYIGSDDDDKCEDYIDSLSSIVLSNGRDVNERLKDISKDTDYLFYIVHTRHINVDFNKLPSKMNVFMHPVNFTRKNSNIKDIRQLIARVTANVAQSEFDGTIESNIRLAQLINRKHGNYPEVLIEGSISKKVSFLTLSNVRVVYSNEFKCENVYISSAVLVSKTNNQAFVNNFIIDTETFTYYSILHYLVTDQFTLVDFNKDNDTIPEYQISYYDTFWGIQCVYDGIFTHGKYHYKVPYKVTKKLAIICLSHHIIIEAFNKDLTEYPDVNITITDDALLDDDDVVDALSGLDIISIESNGFDTINKNIWPSVFVVYDNKKFTLDKSKSDLNVDEEQIYTYGPNTHHSKKHIIIGTVVAVVAVIAVIVVVVVVVVLKKRNANNEVYSKALLNNDQNQINDYLNPVPNSSNL